MAGDLDIVVGSGFCLAFQASMADCCSNTLTAFCLFIIRDRFSCPIAILVSMYDLVVLVSLSCALLCGIYRLCSLSYRILGPNNTSILLSNLRRRMSRN